MVAEQHGAVATEYPLVEEVLYEVEQLVFADVDGTGVVGVGLRVADAVELGLAAVVGVLLAGFAEHPFAALLVVDVVAQHVGTDRVSMRVLAAHPRSLAFGAVGLHGVEDLSRDEGFVGGLG
ncbi:hypothetical protein [Nocardia bovistercoris]|uniref:Uncharacterized protein n=1 Tax=Nocardia bovistercoris TaxID=2785916 RepID=A0A931IBT1_9NOCA|nr:hypothetical protein [Nocardia bovistercoris]MBH0777676.1 hypothetical protein [Nocardia bovistercoris]